MEDQEKDKKPEVEEMYGLRLTLDESLDKYKGPEFEPPKLKEIREKFKTA